MYNVRRRQRQVAKRLGRSLAGLRYGTISAASVNNLHPACLHVGKLLHFPNCPSRYCIIPSVIFTFIRPLEIRSRMLLIETPVADRHPLLGGIACLKESYALYSGLNNVDMLGLIPSQSGIHRTIG